MASRFEMINHPSTLIIIDNRYWHLMDLSDEQVNRKMVFKVLDIKRDVVVVLKVFHPTEIRRFGMMTEY